MSSVSEIIQLIDRAIATDPENTITSGGIIADGYNEEVDAYRDVIYNGKQWLAEYQSELVQGSGISNLKIKYTGVSGYFIEIPKSQLHKVPDTFVHKQTLVNASRFVTQELKDFERRVIEGEQKLAQKEYDLFLEIREQILDTFQLIKDASTMIASLDYHTALAHVAYARNYVRPKVGKGYALSVEGGRHPVIESMEKEFISNDVHLDSKKYIHIITGPNMGGKSTFLRQNALIVLLAHLGSFVPAREAIIPVTDKIFSRVGASDNLYLGQSTFMVEMQEVANILHNATKNSFVIIDEVGRGTSTYDGMSLAWAILKYLHDTVQVKTLFATHYHELVDDSLTLSGVDNYSVAVGENDDTIVFLRKIIPGSMKKSYGLEVAKLAGISKTVITEARKMLKTLELEHNKGTQLSIDVLEKCTPVQETPDPSEVETILVQIDPNSMTPMEALNLLQELKDKI